MIGTMNAQKTPPPEVATDARCGPCPPRFGAARPLLVAGDTDLGVLTGLGSRRAGANNIDWN
jgi:hypothetical protein